VAASSAVTGISTGPLFIKPDIPAIGRGAEKSCGP
jgi:hypothetical protein